MDDNIIIIGGGFFGSIVALKLKELHNASVQIIEREDDLLLRASYNNQARVHNGYHYPRSILTALRSRINFPRFLNDFKEAIDDSFDKYYAIGKIQSKINRLQFVNFCKKIGAPLFDAEEKITRLFNQNYIDGIFKVREVAFDPVILKDLVKKKLEKAQIPIKYNYEVISLREKEDKKIEVKIKQTSNGNIETIHSDYVYNCTYSCINNILARSNLEIIPLKHEFTEMALIEVPDELKNIGITVMCGPFFSIMPFPPMQLHTMSHVRYTPHQYWLDDKKCEIDNQKYFELSDRKSNFINMIKDIRKYLPIIEGAIYRDSIWEIKTLLPQSEFNDSRPILFKVNEKNKRIISILGGKIDNIYDLEALLKEKVSNQGGLV